MINPYRGIKLNNRFYDYLEDSPLKSIQLKNSVDATQNSITASNLGGTDATFTITLALDSTYNVKAGSSNVGATTWVGVSRLADLEIFAGAQGVSNPIDFITPWGTSHKVVPIGSLDISMFNPANPEADDGNGVEFRVSLTLATIS